MSSWWTPSLGRYGVPNALRAEGCIVHTLWSVYGDAAEQHLPDEIWTRDASEHGWVILAGDRSIPALLGPEAMYELQLAIFALPRNNYSGDEQIRRYVTQLPEIRRIGLHAPRPYMYGVYDDKLKKLWPK